VLEIVERSDSIVENKTHLHIETTLNYIPTHDQSPPPPPSIDRPAFPCSQRLLSGHSPIQGNGLSTIVTEIYWHSPVYTNQSIQHLVFAPVSPTLIRYDPSAVPEEAMPSERMTGALTLG
jgi:hypothetical protein